MIEKSVRCRPFIGRRRELLTLDERRKALAQSAGSFVLVCGEAGIGKTRLLNEFLSIAPDRRARNVVVAECLQAAQRPLGPIRSFVRTLASAAPSSNASPAMRRAIAQLAPDAMESSATRGADGGPLEKDQLFSALLEILQAACAKRATVLAVEDVHWADASTIEFLSYLANRMATTRLMVVATSRIDDLERDESLVAAMAPLFRAPTFSRLSLAPLNADGIRAVVDGTVEGRDPLPVDVARDIERRSEGNPFFAEELVKHYLERPDTGRGRSSLPLSIRASILQRLVDLDTDERTIVSHAAVLGQRFDPSVLAAILGRDADALVPALLHARALDLLVEADEGRFTSRFRHALTRQTVYESIPAFEARAIHEKALAKLEAMSGSQRFIEELAYHAWEAGDSNRTVRYNESAGDAAFAVRALPESLTCYRRALDAASDLDDRARLLDRVAAVERVQGHSSEALQALEAALAIRLDRGEIDAASQLAASILGQRYNIADPTALSFAERFLADHGEAMSAGARDGMLVVCARVACALGDFAAAERFLAALSVPPTLTDGARQNLLIVQLMRYAYVDDVTSWRGIAGEVERLLPRLRPEAIVSIEAALAVTGVFLGANAEVESALDRAERVEKEWGFRGQRLYALATRGSYLFQRGRLAEARACISEVAANQDFRPARRVGALVAAHLGAALGDDALWKRFDPAVLREARDQPRDPDCGYILAAHAALAAAGGALREAQDDVRAALASLSHIAPEAMYVAIHAAALLPPDDLGPLRSLVCAQAPGGDATKAVCALVRATIDKRTGEEASAVSQALTAATLFARLGWPLLQSAALQVGGKTEEARAIYAACGASGALARLAARSRAADALSAREREVAALVARGMRNAQIADELKIGKKTVEKHLASIFSKLGLESRAQLAAYLTASGESSVGMTGNG